MLRYSCYTEGSGVASPTILDVLKVLGVCCLQERALSPPCCATATTQQAALVLLIHTLGCLLPAGEGIEPTMLRYSYYTAGSGGAGPTILETSFLLAGEQCTVYKEGQAYKLPPISNRREVDFGPGGR
jgi:hypothetical protein